MRFQLTRLASRGSSLMKTIGWPPLPRMITRNRGWPPQPRVASATAGGLTQPRVASASANDHGKEPTPLPSSSSLSLPPLSLPLPLFLPCCSINFHRSQDLGPQPRATMFASRASSLASERRDLAPT